MKTMKVLLIQRRVEKIEFTCLHEIGFSDRHQRPVVKAPVEVSLVKFVVI